MAARLAVCLADLWVMHLAASKVAQSGMKTVESKDDSLVVPKAALKACT